MTARLLRTAALGSLLLAGTALTAQAAGTLVITYKDSTLR